MTIHPEVLWHSTDPTHAKVSVVVGPNGSPRGAIVEPTLAAAGAPVKFSFDPERRVITDIHVPGPLPTRGELFTALTDPISVKDFLDLAEIWKQVGSDDLLRQLTALPIRLLRLRERSQHCDPVIGPRKRAY